MTTPLQRQLRDFVVAATIAIAIGSCAFVAARNADAIDRQLALAQRSAHAVATAAAAELDAAMLPTTRVALVGPSQPSPKYSFLHHREIRELGKPADHRDDKLFHDSARRLDTITDFIQQITDNVHWMSMFAAADRAQLGRWTELIHDGSGRVIAAEYSTTRAPFAVVAITEPAQLAPYPLLVMIGVLGLGFALAAAGALGGRRATGAGTFAGLATLAVPTLLWHSWIAATAIVIVAAVTALAQRTGATDALAVGLRRNRVAATFLAPAALAMFVLVAAPFVIGIVLGFYDHHQGTWTFVGIDNFVEILSGGGRGLDDAQNFWFILGVTVLWTACNIALHVTIGVALALVLSRTWLRGKGVFRMLLILPWAIPNYITALIWKGMFQGQYGAVNSLLHALHLHDVSWFSSWAAAFSANVVTNTWLGFPFMMVVALGALETIPRELYEAASVDGATAWQRFRHITLPHLRPALGPAVALGSIWTFNMFNVIFLVSAGKPGDSTNILVTDAYRWAFERGDRYGMAAAYATIIFLVLLLWTVFGTRIIRSKDEAFA